MSCPTYAQLEAETWWGREIRTVELKWLGDELCRRTGAAADSIGTKGNNCHLNGGHRSQEWITHSAFCTNHSYTVQSGLTADQLRHIAALDRTPLTWGTTANRAQVAVETKRLLAAAKAGQLKGITQIEGTLDGKTMFGYNVGNGTTFTPDSSHLEHWHLTFDRRFLHDQALMQRIVDAALGGPEGEDMASMFVKFGDGENVQGGLDEVTEFQADLAELGADFTPVGGIDGKFGPGTQERYIAIVGADVAGDGTHYNAKARRIVKRRIGEQRAKAIVEAAVAAYLKANPPTASLPDNLQAKITAHVLTIPEVELHVADQIVTLVTS
jgi:hypothetical protein